MGSSEAGGSAQAGVSAFPRQAGSIACCADLPIKGDAPSASAFLHRGHWAPGQPGCWVGRRGSQVFMGPACPKGKDRAHTDLPSGAPWAEAKEYGAGPSVGCGVTGALQGPGPHAWAGPGQAGEGRWKPREGQQSEWGPQQAHALALAADLPTRAPWAGHGPADRRPGSSPQSTALPSTPALPAPRPPVLGEWATPRD